MKKWIVLGRGVTRTLPLREPAVFGNGDIIAQEIPLVNPFFEKSENNFCFDKGLLPDEIAGGSVPCLDEGLDF